MRPIKERLLMKLRIIPSLNTLKHGLVSQLNSPEKLLDQNTPDLKISSLPEAVGGDSVRVSKDITQESGNEEVECEFHDPDMKNAKNSTTFGDPRAQVSATMEEEYRNLSDFEEKIPPGGIDSVVLYTTSLRSIRKTFEDCQVIKFLLQSFKVVYDERDVSMQLEFREELWGVMGKRVIPPRLFIKGRFIGGADEVIALHEQGKLKKLLKGIPVALSSCPCNGCGNFRFVVCPNCNGSQKVFKDGEGDGGCTRCPECNENGLVKCPICR